jgi:beta-glucosidase
VRRKAGVLGTLVALAVLAIAPAAHAQSPNCPWMNKAGKTPVQRANELIRAMSLDQKIHQVTYSSPAWFAYYGMAGHVDATPELCIPLLGLSDAGSGVAGEQTGTTTFPSGVGQAATWNPALEQQFGKAVGEEAWNKGINVMLGPGLNILRTPLNGRNFEYMGEDPFLAGKTAAAAIRGIQSEPVLAEAKHYAANNQETDRNTINASVDERTLREIYLPAFEAAIKEGHVGSVMCAYNKLNGPYACENPELLNGYLRRDWDFDGFVTSDWGALHSTIPSAQAGTDLEMNVAGTQYYSSPLRDAVSGGKLPVGVLDGMLRHIFVPMFEFGLFEHPPAPQPGAYQANVSTPEHRALARHVAEEATVLLKNAGGLLPLDRGTGRTIGVLGYAANPSGASNTSGGGGSSKGSGVPAPVSPLEGIQTQAAAHGDRVIYSDGSKTADAAAVAAASDVVIAFASDSESEGSDKPDMGLHPGACPFPVCVPVPSEDQDAMIEAAAGANPNIAVVVNTGTPVTMPWLGRIKSLLVPFYSGTENGNAIAAVLYGETPPSGKLPQTWPKRLEDGPLKTQQQYPGTDGKAVYSEGLKVGYRWFDSAGVEPLFPFGFGLSYTSFHYADLLVTPGNGTARVRFTITNTGDRAGAEVGQVYVGFPASTGEPPRQLKGFRKLALGRGESDTATVDLDRRAFSYWDAKSDRWVQRSGCYRIYVGGSSRSAPLQGIAPIGAKQCGPTATRGCAKQRYVITQVKPMRRHRARSIAVYINGKRAKVKRIGRSGLRYLIDARTKRTSHVRVVVRLKNGRRFTLRRTYRRCLH